jgi:hypothetical protein
VAFDFERGFISQSWQAHKFCCRLHFMKFYGIGSKNIQAQARFLRLSHGPSPYSTCNSDAFSTTSHSSQLERGVLLHIARVHRPSEPERRVSRRAGCPDSNHPIRRAACNRESNVQLILPRSWSGRMGCDCSWLVSCLVHIHHIGCACNRESI